MSDAPEDMSKPDATDETKLAKTDGAADAEAAAASHADTPKADTPKDAAGTSLAPAVEAPTGIDPFLAKASEAPEPAGPRPLYARALDYSAHAAMIVGLIGFAWTVSDHVTSRKPADTATPVKAADASGTATPKSVDGKSADAKSADATSAYAKSADVTSDELGDLRRSNQKMAAEIRGLHASLEALRTTVVRERGSGDDVRSLSATVDQVKAGLAAARSEQTTQIAMLAGKVDKLQRDARQQVAERTARAETRTPERAQVDTTATASIPAPAAKAVPTPPAKPTVLASTEPEGRQDSGHNEQADDGKPPVISGWVVRDVYQGVALIEGRRGSMEVVPGVSIPGAGVVRSIDRHGGGWTVTTTKGQLAYSAPQREPRRYRDYYGPRRYDF